ncbi:zinc finger protein 891-like [Sitophilus oryzae]|uniref:Zinc finger protein 891-like n=1 Tax=Sitophilus oryzae TaxID=7048 RepID=A0A6J2Y0Z9_SITOR|nr:zinc finger protein 891-like [Sitophilus oryzae]XP_030757429.1 zinc finger protein 891-like [Sitophilus oryzae]XP_030757430.1 zinc finger protein 891-like [Sitophilus oryzae]
MDELGNTIEKLEICRLCLSLTVTKFNIFTDDFPKMIEMLTSIKIKSDDALPKISCLKCTRDVKSAFMVRRRIIQSYRLLNSKINRMRQSQVRNNIESTSRTLIHNLISLENITNTVSRDNESLTRIDNVEKRMVQTPVLTVKTESDKHLGMHNVSHELPVNAQNDLKLLESRQKTSSWKTMSNNDQLSIIKWIERKEIKTTNLTSRLASTQQQRKKELLKMYCNHCQIKFTNRTAFNNHMTRHKSKTCPVCNKLVRSSYFKKHMTFHESCPVICEVCGETCKNLCSLKMHFTYYHKNPSMLVCEDCGRLFRTKTKLLYHRRKDHTKERNYKCETCGKTFFLKLYLTKHINMKHMKMRPHICEYCGKGFSGKHALRTHVRQHTNEAPYQCNICGEGFRQRVSLRGHLKSKHSIQEENTQFCKICGKGFASVVALDVHSRLHAEIKCPWCTDTFADKTYLEQHVNSTHPDAGAEVIEAEGLEWVNL